MAQYINKSALVAELNKRLQERKSIKPSKEDDFGKGYLWGRDTEDKAVLYFIDTLEVKEVDLEKESLTWEDIPKIFSISEQLKTSWWFRDNEQTKKIGTQVFWEDVLKRFKAQKGEKV